jgi:alanine racemase
VSAAWTRREVVALALGSLVPRPSPVAHVAELSMPRQPSAGFEPWIEVDAAAIRANVAAVSAMAGGRPILAVVKNNAYGLGLEMAGPVVDGLAEVRGLAVVRADEAIRLRRAGARKPILLMGRVTDEEALELARMDVRLGVYGDDAPEQLARVSRMLGRPVPAHLYMDTGMNRMGQRVDRAGAWLDGLARGRAIAIEGTFTELTEERDFDVEQTGRLRAFADRVRRAGLDPGPLHAASSMEVVHVPQTHLDLVRPGFALWGGYVTPEARAAGGLRPTVSLKAPVVRVEHLNTGDGVSYERPWKAERPTWIAVLPVGHADGYPRAAVKGAEVLIGGRLYQVIAAVSASHTIIEVGGAQTVRIGEVATLIGSGHEAIHPNEVAARSGTSTYDRFMHLSSALTRRLV